MRYLASLLVALFALTACSSGTGKKDGCPCGDKTACDEKCGCGCGPN